MHVYRRLIEPLAIFGFIMAYIWRLRFTHPLLWLPALGLIAMCHIARHERPPALGFRITNLGDCLRRFGPALAVIGLAMWAIGREFGTIRRIGPEHAAWALALYLPWGLFQQYLLNGYFLNRFDNVLPPRAAGVTTAALFSIVHSPNWFLMLVTSLGGYVAVQVYRRYRNLYFLGAAHAIIGFLLFLVVPDSISHHLNIGPGSLRS